MGGLSVQSATGFFENLGNIFYTDVATKFTENFDEPAHMRALMAIGQIDINVYAGDGVLSAIKFIQHHNWIGNILNPDLVDIDVAMIGPALHIGNFGQGSDNGLPFVHLMFSSWAVHRFFTKLMAVAQILSLWGSTAQN